MNRYTFLTAAIAAALVGVAVAAPQDPSQDARGGKPDRGQRMASIDTNGDGVIDRSEAAAHPRLAQRFDTMDKNGDGRLDASERPQRKKGHRGGGMEALLKLDTDGYGRISKVEAAANERFAPRFDSIDSNRDGYLVRSELTAASEKRRAEWQAKHRERMQQKFAEADANKDGRLSRAEVESGMPKLAQRFEFMDEDRDGYLTPADFQRPRR